MMHESIHELETAVMLIQRQKNGFTFRDRAYPLDPAVLQQTERPVAEKELLAQLLYSEAYARKKSAGKASLSMLPPTPGYLQEQHAFTENLSAHNHTRERAETGYLVNAVYQHNQVSVSKKGVSHFLQSTEYICPPGQTVPVVNTYVTRRFLKENRQLQPAFYYVYSESGFDHAPTVLRIYWNLEAAGAATLIGCITRQLNHYRLPFLFKCLNHPSMYNRRDAAVLYIQKRYAHVLTTLLPGIIAEVSPFLQPDVPLFTHALAPGVGFAESPANGDSFGMTRVRIAASGLLQAFNKQVTRPGQVMEEVLDAFAQHGISTQVPYLNRGSDFSFSLPPDHLPAI